jgi:uncharacterized protein
MQLSLRSLQDAHEHFEKQFEASVFPAAPDASGTTEDEPFRVASPVTLSFDIDRQETGRYRVAGQLTGELELTCSRCIEPFTLPVVADVDLRYVPRVENAGDGEREVQEDDLSTSFYDNGEIDLLQLMMEQFQLALPMKPLCTETCKGLCPQCGTNLNTGTCDCSQKWEDPRLAALRAMKRISEK